MDTLQNMHVLFWLLKDMSWCSSWHKLGLIMVGPTLYLAARIAWETRKSLSEFVHNLAVCLWICANITWMMGEFFYEDGTRPYARIFFFAGLGMLGVYYLAAPRKRWRMFKWTRGRGETVSLLWR